MGVGGQRHNTADLPPPPRGKTRFSLYRRVGWPQSRSGRVRNISPSTGIRSLDRPARNESLYQLRYPGSLQKNISVFKYSLQMDRAGSTHGGHKTVKPAYNGTAWDRQ